METLRQQTVARQAQWARFRAWEERCGRRGRPFPGEEAVRAVGEIVEFYLRVSGAVASRSVTQKAEAIRRLRQALRFVPPVR